MNRIAIYCYYDKAGEIRKSSVAQIKDLLTVVDKLVIVINGSVKTTDPFYKFTDFVIERSNDSYDAGAYWEVITSGEYHDIWEKFDECIFCNNSFYGPFIPFEEIFQSMEKRSCDFWGLSSAEKNLVHHIQSYFCVFRKKILTSGILKKYFVTYIDPMKMDYREVCNVFEDGISDYLLGRGFQMDAYARDIVCDNYRNPYGSLKLDRLPVLKKKVFSPAYYDKNQIIACLNYIKKNYQYDIRFIIEEAKDEYRLDEKSWMTDGQNRVVVRSDIHQNIMLKNWIQIREFIDSNDRVFIYGSGECASGVFAHFFHSMENEKFGGFISEKPSITDLIKPNIRWNRLNEMELDKNAAILVCVEDYEMEWTRCVLQSFTHVFYIWKDDIDLSDLMIDISDTVITAYGKYFYHGKRMLTVIDEEGKYCGIIGREEFKNSYLFSENTPVSAIYNPDGVYLVQRGNYMESARNIFQNTKIRKIPLVDEDGYFVTLLARWHVMESYGQQTAP